MLQNRGSAISQAYGTWQGYDEEEYFSDHICIAGEEGDPVYAAMDGVVEEEQPVTVCSLP